MLAAMALNDLSREDRMRLMRFVCSFAWADLEIQSEERRYVSTLVAKLELDDGDKQRVNEWLTVPPKPEDVDPAQVPRAHRQLFLKTIRDVIKADKHIDPEESENLELFEALLGS